MSNSPENGRPPLRIRGFSRFLPLTTKPAKASNPVGPIFMGRGDDIYHVAFFACGLSGFHTLMAGGAGHLNSHWPQPTHLSFTTMGNGLV